MEPTIPITGVTAEVLTEDILLYPIDLEISESNAIPHPDRREGVSRLEGALEEPFCVLAPELADAGVRHPILERLNIAHGRRLSLRGRRRADRSKVWYWLR